MKLLWLLCGVCLVGQCRASDDESVARLVVGSFVNCLESDLSLCLKEHALKATQRLRTVRKLKITGDLVLVNHAYKEARSLEPLSSELELRKQQVSQRLWDTASDILRNSDLEYSFSDDDDEEESRAIGDEGRGKKKKKEKKKLILSLAILGKIKAIVLAIAFLGIIAVSIFKIAVIAKIAFIVKAIAVIKALLLKKHQQEEHSWVTHEEPHVHEHGGWDQGGSHGWSRSRNEANNLAYSAYNNN